MVVQSSTDKDKTYTVKTDRYECDANCALKCQECNICVHMYSCNFSDPLIHHTICKHVHLVASTIHLLSSLSPEIQQCETLSALSNVESLIKAANNAIRVNISDSSQLCLVVNEQ